MSKILLQVYIEIMDIKSLCEVLEVVLQIYLIDFLFNLLIDMWDLSYHRLILFTWIFLQVLKKQK